MPSYTPVHVGETIVGKDAYKDYRLTSKVRDASRFKDFSDYRRIARKIWKKIAEASVIYESGVYDKDFFYIVPQVISNKPFIELHNGKIKTNNHTNGDMYTPVFSNLFKSVNHFCWSLDGSFVFTYKERLNNIINKFVPKYYFILPILRKNKL